MFRAMINKPIFSPFTLQAMRLSTADKANDIRDKKLSIEDKKLSVEDLQKQIKSFEKKIELLHQENVSFFQSMEKKSLLRKQDIQETIALYFFLNILFSATIGHFIY